MTTFKFEQLAVWQRALDLSERIHRVVQKFPREELYVLSSQIKRAADSIALNVAEGSTGQSNAEFRLFVNYAIRSAVEVVACLRIAERRGLMERASVEELGDETERVVRMLYGLRKSLR